RLTRSDAAVLLRPHLGGVLGSARQRRLRGAVDRSAYAGKHGPEVRGVDVRADRQILAVAGDGNGQNLPVCTYIHSADFRAVLTGIRAPINSTAQPTLASTAQHTAEMRTEQNRCIGPSQA